MNWLTPNIMMHIITHFLLIRASKLKMITRLSDATMIFQLYIHVYRLCIYMYATIDMRQHVDELRSYVGAEFKPPSTPFISAGDRVLLEMDFDMLKSSLDEIGSWDNDIVDV